MTPANKTVEIYYIVDEFFKGDCLTVFCMESIVMCPNVLNFM